MRQSSTVCLCGTIIYPSNKHVGGHCFLRPCCVTKPHWHCEHTHTGTHTDKKKEKYRMYNQHEETDQSSAECCSLSLICLSVRLSVGSPPSPSPPMMFAAFRSLCLHLSDSCRQVNRSAAKASVPNSHKTTPRSSQRSSLERNLGSALGALSSTRVLFAAVAQGRPHQETDAV